MAVIKAQKVPQKTESVEDIIATFCYYFPQYTFSQASEMPAKRVRQMLKVARKEEAMRMYNLTQLIAAPHTKKGVGVKTMLKYFKEIIER